MATGDDVCGKQRGGVAGLIEQQPIDGIAADADQGGQPGIFPENALSHRMARRVDAIDLPVAAVLSLRHPPRE